MATHTGPSDAEKAAFDTSITATHHSRYEEVGSSEIQVLADDSRRDLKTTPDGKIILIPQPSGLPTHRHTDIPKLT